MQNIQISSFEVLRLAVELQKLKGAFVEKVYQIGKEDILVKVRKKEEGKFEIFLRAGKFLFITKKHFEVPEKPSMFAILLRKHIGGGKLENIYQYDFDRIIVFEIKKKGNIYRLIVELIPNGNIVLVDENWKITVLLKRQTWSHRILKLKTDYVFPPPSPNLKEMDLQDFSKYLKQSDKDTVRTLAIDLGIGGMYAEEICLLSGIPKEKNVRELDDKEIEKIYKSIKELLQKLGKLEHNPEIVLENNQPKAITSLHLKKFDNFTTIAKKSISEALEEVFCEESESESSEEKKTEGIIDRQIKAIEELLKKSEEKRVEGDLIFMHLKEIDDIIIKLRDVMKRKDSENLLDEIKSMDMIDDIDLQNGIVRLKLQDLRGKEISISIDIRKSAAENGNLAYRLSKKYRKKAERAREVLMRSYGEMKKKDKKEEKIVEKIYWFEKYRWSITSQGNLIIAGKDAKTNERIVKKYMEEKDIYIHADMHGAPSCILKSRDTKGNPKEIGEESIEEACQFAGVYSKAWKQFGEVMVYWVYPYQVSKTPQSGEFLPKGAFVIRGKRNYIRCKMEMAIGEVNIEGNRKIIGGAVRSLEKLSKRYIIIQPGKIKREKFAKVLSEKFGVSIDKILKVLPPGDAQVVKSIGLDVGDIK